VSFGDRAASASSVIEGCDHDIRALLGSIDLDLVEDRSG
jgi:hypothetical protein